MIDYTKIRDKFEGRKIYSYKEVLQTISPQSSTASYILQNLLASGSLEQTVNGFRKVQ